MAKDARLSGGQYNYSSEAVYCKALHKFCVNFVKHNDATFKLTGPHIANMSGLYDV